ncbi:MAG: 16S rRNA (guanine(966)-N(2))-methyltransferase RsmD [Thermoleophilaceae bacterium]|nr:16S rRNA (guanine(966)-N(2))-methyltransferase RsmD [Thermoleophilaceae bacterium]
MRVVAGKHRGRRLHSPAGATTRPTADRVREAVFSILGPLDGLNVLDLYAGSGALGIEALSRGAAAATFVEHDRAALATIEANLTTIGERASVLRRDVVSYLEAVAVQDSAQFDVVFADPPYSSAGLIGEHLSRLLPGVLASEARIVTESDKRNPLLLDLPLESERIYGGTRIVIHNAH